MRRAPSALSLQLATMGTVGVGFVLTTLSLSRANVPASQPTALSSAAGPTTPIGRVLRESSKLLDRTGTVRSSGARLVFTTDDGRWTMVLLENRMLERVEQLLSTGTAAPRLLVSGTVTEYRKRNYLLLTRVFMDAQNIPSRE